VHKVFGFAATGVNWTGNNLVIGWFNFVPNRQVWNILNFVYGNI
jgi:hypothetical protein